jgi:hypothetical protein
MRSPGLTPLRSGVTGGLIELTVALAISGEPGDLAHLVGRVQRRHLVGLG